MEIETVITNYAKELRRFSRKVGYPRGDIPAVMNAAAAYIECLESRLISLEEELFKLNQDNQSV